MTTELKFQSSFPSCSVGFHCFCRLVSYKFACPRRNLAHGDGMERFWVQATLNSSCWLELSNANVPCLPSATAVFDDKPSSAFGH